MGSSSTRKKVAVLIESSRAYGRGLLVGVSKFAQMTDAWSTWQAAERTLDDDLPDWFHFDRFDGVIIRSEHKGMLDRIVDSGIPTVDLRAAHRSGAFVVETDDSQVAKLAVDHLASRGHRNFSFCGYADANYSKRRLGFFCQSVQSLKGSHLADPFESKIDANGQTISQIEAATTVVEDDLVDWLEGLPKPIGIMACNDARGVQLLKACRQLGIEVPDDVAVVGVDNDEVLCNLAIPPLSSVENNTPMIGFYAAELLHRLMKKEYDAGERIHLVDPTRVIRRRSTDSSMIGDKAVSRAITFIRENACNGIDVSDVVDAVPLSRASIERRFSKFLGRSINTEIRRTRLKKVRELLLETDMKLLVIARVTGFVNPEYLSTLFKKEYGVSPSQYRRDNRQFDPGDF